MEFNARKHIFPRGLVNCDQWILWKTEVRDGKETKVPVNPNNLSKAMVNESETWSDFDTADEISRDMAKYGLGFVFTKDDPFVGIDLDKVRDPDSGSVSNDDIRFIVEKMDTYTEVSPSGTGYHIISRGKLPDGRTRHNGIEMYDNARFFTMSGNHVDGSPQMTKERTAEMKLIHGAFLEKQEKKNNNRKKKHVKPTDVDMEDEEVIKRATSSASAKKFRDFWNGRWEHYSYDSQSEADMAFACMLAFWTGGDFEQTMRMFRESDMYREKWDETHYSNGDTYGERTVQKAIENQEDFYGNRPSN
jgi:putative DNA primase/helicase